MVESFVGSRKRSLRFISFATYVSVPYGFMNHLNCFVGEKLSPLERLSHSDMETTFIGQGSFILQLLAPEPIANEN